MDNQLETIFLEHIELRDVQDEPSLIPQLAKYMYIIHKINLSTANSELSMVPFFRGQSDEAWNINPSVFRQGHLNHEHELIHDAIRKSPKELAKGLTNFERLTKLQHYGLPTRLLDVTENPLVALYFACEHNPDHDAAVYITHAYPYDPDSKPIQILSLIAHLNINGLSLRELWLELENENINFPLISTKQASLSLDELINLMGRNYFVLPNLDNSRIKHQQGAFLLCGCIKAVSQDDIQDDIWNTVFEKTQENLLEEFTHKIIIPSVLKPEILRELDQYNFNEASMYPELDHQMNYIAHKRLQPLILFHQPDADGEPDADDEIDFTPSNTIDISSEAPKEFTKPRADVPIELHSIISNYIYDTATADTVYQIFLKSANIDWPIRKQLQAGISRNIARYLQESGYHQTIHECSAVAKSIVDDAVRVNNSTQQNGLQVV